MGVRVMIPTISPVSDISVMPLCVLSWCSSPMVPPFARGLVSGEIWDRMFDSGCNPCAAVRVHCPFAPSLKEWGPGFRGMLTDEYVHYSSLRIPRTSWASRWVPFHPGDLDRWAKRRQLRLLHASYIEIDDSIQIANFCLFFSCISRLDAHFDPSRPPGCCLRIALLSPLHRPFAPSLKEWGPGFRGMLTDEYVHCGNSYWCRTSSPI